MNLPKDELDAQFTSAILQIEKNFLIGGLILGRPYLVNDMVVIRLQGKGFLKL